MIPIETFPTHLQTLSYEDWQPLFALLPGIETTTTFGELKGGEKLVDGSVTFPYWIPSAIVEQTSHTIHSLQLCPVFNWQQWTEGTAMLNNRDFDYAQLPVIDLCKLFTVMMRADRFHEGYLVSCFTNGSVAKIIRTLQQQIMSAE